MLIFCWKISTIFFIFLRLLSGKYIKICNLKLIKGLEHFPAIYLLFYFMFYWFLIHFYSILFFFYWFHIHFCSILFFLLVSHTFLFYFHFLLVSHIFLGCNPEDLPKAMNDRKKWRERVRDIRAGGTTWWWWWFYNIFYYNYSVTNNLLSIL